MPSRAISLSRRSLSFFHGLPELHQWMGRASIPQWRPKSRYSILVTRDFRSSIINQLDRPDPTAKRPTIKCDPYGLSGQSLSYQECSKLMSTLDDGWELVNAISTDEVGAPTFLERQFYHETFYTASRFISQISLVCTNLNHYPHLSIERVVVDDLNRYYSADGAIRNDNKRRKVKGWVFVSTVRCSTNRPPVKSGDRAKIAESEKVEHVNKGLTYHDFHLAMNIDTETKREELGQLLLKVVKETNCDNE